MSILCGARVTAFSIVGAYTSSEGGNYTIFTHSLLHIAGALLPFMVSICFLLFLQERQRKETLSYHCILYYHCLSGKPVLVGIRTYSLSFGNVPPSDDVSQFLEVSKIHPLIVSVCAAAVVILYLMWMWKKKSSRTG